MADESGKQKLEVEKGTGATLGVDAGTDTDQTNRELSADDGDKGGDKGGGSIHAERGAGGTSIKADTAKTYGAGEPENTAGGTTSGGAGGSTGTGAEVGQGIAYKESDVFSSGAANTREVTKDDDK